MTATLSPGVCLRVLVPQKLELGQENRLSHAIQPHHEVPVVRGVEVDI